jgi:hypothetical protein
MEIYNLGMLQIFVPKRGLNRDTMETEYKKGKLEFTNKAVKAYNEEKEKQATIMVPISNVAFEANGITKTTFDSWIKTVVWDMIGSTRAENYSTDSYNDLRNRLVT